MYLYVKLYLKLSNNLHEALKKTCLHGESYSINCCLGMGKYLQVLFQNEDKIIEIEEKRIKNDKENRFK